MVTKRRYNTRLIKATWPYDVEEIAKLLGVHKNAVFRWLKEGLKGDITTRPYLVRGSDLIQFLNERQEDRRRRCATDEFFCFKCRAPRHACGNKANLVAESAGRFRVKVRCAICGTSMNKSQGIRNLPDIVAAFHVQQRHGWHLIDGSDPSVNSDMRSNHELPGDDQS